MCQLDGSWRGVQPACAVQTAAAVPGVGAAVSGNGVSVTWNTASLNTGYFSGSPAQQFQVSAIANDVLETYQLAAFPAFVPVTVQLPYCPSASINCVRPGSTYIGGNWYKLLEKNTNYLQNTWDPANTVTQPGCSPWPDCAFVSTTNTWDFWNGYLRLDSDAGRNNWGDNNDNMVLYRDFPPGLNPAAQWSIESFVSLDTVNILSQGNQNVNIGILDLGEYGNTGAIEMYAGVRNDGAPYSIGFESSINQACTLDNTLSTDPYHPPTHPSS